LEDNLLGFITIMFNCTDKTSRFYIGRFTTLVLNKAFAILEDCEKRMKEENDSGQMSEPSASYLDLKNHAYKLLDLCIMNL